MNIAEILKKYAKGGDKFYSPALGDVTYLFCVENCDTPIIVIDKKGDQHKFTSEGYLYFIPGSECLLFPRADQRDWNKYVQEHRGTFKVDDHVVWGGVQYYISGVIDARDDSDNICIIPVIYQKSATAWVSPDEIERCDHFDPKPLEHYDKIIGWNESMGRWVIDFFQFIIEDATHKYVGMANSYTWVIPYNEETESLVGTANDLPDFYLENEN